MNKRDYLTALQDLGSLPVPGTILYPPAEKVYGHKLKYYKINEEDIIAVVGGSIHPWVDIDWTLEQVRMCTYELR